MRAFPGSSYLGWIAAMEHLPKYLCGLKISCLFYPFHQKWKMLLTVLDLFESLQLYSFSVPIIWQSKALRSWGPKSVSGGLMLGLNGLSQHWHHIWSLPRCAAGAKGVKGCCICGVFFFFLLLVLLGKQQDLCSFQLIAALRESAKKYLLKLSPI